MNIVIQQLSKKQNLQDFFIALLGDVEKYFKGAPPMSDEKANATINTIFTRISRDFPLISSIHSIAKRLSNDLRDKINDKCEGNQTKKKGSGLKSFMEGIRSSNQTMTRGSSQQSLQNKHNWVKKMLLQSIIQLKQDIRQADLLTAEVLKLKLERLVIKGKDLPMIVFIDSFLTNVKIIEELSGYQVKSVICNSAQTKAGEMNLMDAARILKQSRLLIISADAVFRNGGILAKSGSLMLAIIASQLGIPILALSRSYCLSDEILLNQQRLVQEQSSKEYFPQEEDQFRVLIAKKYDYVQPRLISSLVGENKGWERQSIAEIFEEYYS